MSNKIGSRRTHKATPRSAGAAPAHTKRTQPRAATWPSSSFASSKASTVELHPQQPVVASAIRFDASNPEVRAFAQSRGWAQPGLKTTVFQADLVYSTDGWKTTHTAPLQYLMNGQQGFILRDLPEGTPVEYAVHAQVGVSHDNFYSLDERADLWANNGGQNYRGASGSVVG